MEGLIFAAIISTFLVIIINIIGTWITLRTLYFHYLANGDNHEIALDKARDAYVKIQEWRNTDPSIEE